MAAETKSTETKAALRGQIAELQERLDEAEATLRALRAGEVDAIIATGPDGECVYTLRGADQAYRVMVESMAEGALTLAADGLILFSNERFATLVRKPLERVIGARIQDLTEPQDAARICALLSEGQGGHAEIGLRIDGSEPIPVDSYAEDLMLDGIRCICLIVRDLTGQRHNEEIKLSRERLLESERSLKLLADAMPQIVWTACPDGYFEYYNQQWYDFTGSSAELTGDENWKAILHSGDVQLFRDGWSAAVKSGEPYALQCRLWDRKCNSYRWHLGRALPVRDKSGAIVKWVGTCTDIDDQKRFSEKLEQRVASRTAELQRSLLETTTLLQEVHHRVRNNLQLICALLSMQVDNAPENAAGGLLREAHNRVLAMSLVHEQLYRSESLSSIDFSRFIERISGEILRTYAADSAVIELALAVEPVHLSIGAAIPCGLILNELISNALKHAFRGRARGTVQVCLKRADVRNVELSVAYDGVGLPEDFHFEESGSVGFRIIRALVQQLGADFKISSRAGKGSEFKWMFCESGEPA
jgi:PAS domain S-box-containing protein